MINDCQDLKIINSFLDNFNTKINEISTYQKFLIFEKGKDNIGFLDYSIIFDRIEINYIYVDENYRNKNIASQLIDYIIKNNRCNNISLEVNENNLNAIKFYKKNKFSEVARRKNYYGKEDALLMIRELV